MAVSATVNPIVVPIANVDPRLPIAYWAVRASLAGDVSGGDNLIDVAWSRVTPEQLVSLEDLTTYVAGAGAARNTYIQINTGALGTGTNVILFALGMTATLIQGVSFISQSWPAGIPRFIANPTQNAYKISTVTANTNGETLNVAMWGYIWGVIAYQVAGGPVRPT